MSFYRFPVEATHILMFARAIGDENPVYTDPGSPAAAEFGGAIAPPTFTMASAQFDPEYALRPMAGQAWFGSGKEPSGAEIGDTGWLHAEQHFEYHRPFVAGEVLTATEYAGEKWAKKSNRGGTLEFEERRIDYHSAETGEVVVTARFVYVLPSRAAAQD
ncbi:MaoC family dehydratase N-terminal domain-containing protein [Amycolatopsis sp. GM8]|uniref:FAS1-like dehydratase domain-containing protein n=1 Tax=Amycolatopsis sp. GM8 TaxID=2896530 RepID=UPI001F3D1511|nr:MaoC family dehydratase N-terminal domain-containing protein [Amycolatopsis sp. GM8]